jgi:ribosomal protein S18 acetylase RimI-like enzyme
MIIFRTAVLDDSLEIAELVNSAYRGESSKVGWTTEADLLGGQRTNAQLIQEIILDPNSRIEIALQDNRIIGCVHLVFEADNTLYFGMLVVKPLLQTQGLGKSLLSHLEKIAQDTEQKIIRFLVIPQRHELVAFYERRGYLATGKSEPFPEDHLKFGIPKVEGLSLAEYVKFL